MYHIKRFEEMNEGIKSSLYRLKKGENPLKRDETPLWKTRRIGDKYFLKDPKSGQWIEITKSQYDKYNDDREKRFGF